MDFPQMFPQMFPMFSHHFSHLGRDAGPRLDATLREVRHRQLDLEFQQLKLEEKVGTDSGIGLFFLEHLYIIIIIIMGIFHGDIIYIYE